MVCFYTSFAGDGTAMIAFLSNDFQRIILHFSHGFCKIIFQESEDFFMNIYDVVAEISVLDDGTCLHRLLSIDRFCVYARLLRC